MSGLIGAAMPTNVVGIERTNVVLSNCMLWTVGVVLSTDEVSGTVALLVSTMNWQQRGGGLTGEHGKDVGILFGQTVWGDLPPDGAGATRFGFLGVTRDVYGTPLTGVTVTLYRTSDNSVQDIEVSDVNTGQFLLITPYYPDAHYIVAHKSGSPDVDGVTRNNLVAS